MPYDHAFPDDKDVYFLFYFFQFHSKFIYNFFLHAEQVRLFWSHSRACFTTHNDTGNEKKNNHTIYKQFITDSSFSQAVSECFNINNSFALCCSPYVTVRCIQWQWTKTKQKMKMKKQMWTQVAEMEGRAHARTSGEEDKRRRQDGKLYASINRANRTSKWCESEKQRRTARVDSNYINSNSSPNNNHWSIFTFLHMDFRYSHCFFFICSEYFVFFSN